jgi:hypothetical protein
VRGPVGLRGPGIDLSVPGNLEVIGDIVVSGRLIGRRAKIGYVADQFLNAHGDALEEGDVVVISENQSMLTHGAGETIPIPEVDLTENAYDTRVCGIVCEVYGELAAPEQRSGRRKSRKQAELVLRAFTPEERAELGIGTVPPGHVGTMVTLGAYVHCKVDAGPSPIAIGDLLTTSARPGHAQKVLEAEKAVGAILGKALGPREKGRGTIPVLVTLH